MNDGQEYEVTRPVFKVVDGQLTRVGMELVRYRVDVRLDKCSELAKRAAQNDEKEASAGPVKVTVVSQMPVLVRPAAV